MAQENRKRIEPLIAEDILSDEERAVVGGASESAEAEALRAFGRSRTAFAQIWDNPDDAEYDDLL